MECIIQTVMFRPFTGHDVAVSIVIAVLLGCSALVSGSETAFFSLTPRNIAQLKTGRSRSGRGDPEVAVGAGIFAGHYSDRQ